MLSATLWLASLTAPALAQPSNSDKNVLALYWYAREYPTNVLYERGLLRTLRADPRGGPEYYSEYLEVDRFPGEDQAGFLRDYLRQKYAHHRIDVIIATAETPFQFLLANHSLFPDVPIVYTAFGPAGVAAERSGPGVAGILIVGAYRKTLELIRSIHPETEQVLVVTSLPDNGGKARENIVRDELASFEDGLTFKYLTDLPTDTLLGEISHAPPRSVVLYVRHAEESPGSALDPVEAVSLFSRSSPVPIYSAASAYLGHGIVGGYLVDHEVVGAQAGQTALSILAGAPPGTLQANATLAPIFDWREMRRWNISPSRLPAGSDIRFRVPTAWDLYRWYIVGALVLFALQGLTIASLVVQRSRRRESEARNAAILRAVPDTMFLLTRDGTYVDGHAPGESALLARQEDVTGRHVRDVLPPQAAAAFESALARLTPGQSRTIVEYSLQRPEGECRYEARVVPSSNDQVLAVVRDITERKRAEAALTNSRERYALATSAARVGVWDWDLETNEIYVDPSLKAILGYQDDEIRNHLDDWSRLVDPDDASTVVARVQEHLEGKNPSYEVERRMRHRDGSIRWFLARGTAIRRDGRPVRVIGTDTDITERKKSEQALQAAQADLSRLSRLTALGEFAASIAHEVRQPLSAILMNAKTCLRWLAGSSPDLSEVQAALVDVVDAGLRADEVIRRNRELFRHQTVQKTPLDINQVIQDVAELSKSRIQGSHVTFATSLAPDLPIVHGDAIELQQVLLNLIANSVDAMETVDAGSRRIDVCSALSADGDVKVSVADTGIGLEGVDRQQMFTLSYTTKASGTGVGLSISRSIIEAHGGQLWAEQNSGRGATFSFTVPVRSTVAAAS